jgi:predicted TIM-barrel fold metal-dependent hydrolase
MKIDIYTHIIPKKYVEVVNRTCSDIYYNRQINEAIPSISDLDIRFRILDKFDGIMQVLTLGAPPIEAVAGPQKAIELARMANDEMAELVSKYPDRFVSAVASLPIADIDAALNEIDRSINELKFRGVQISTPISGKPIDLPEFFPLYEKMVSYNLPIWIHPMREINKPDYEGESNSKYQIWGIFGWPYETSAAMTRLIFSGILERLPDIKFITHHCGGMVPFFEQRIAASYDMGEMRLKGRTKQRLTKPVIDYFKMFYADTAVQSKAAIACGYEFFGLDHLLFGTDMPYDNQLGLRYLRQTVQAIEELDIPATAKKKIFEDNARKLLRLPI